MWRGVFHECTGQGPYEHSLSRCTIQLISSAAHANTLRTVWIEARTRFNLDDFLEVLPLRGAGLHYLFVDLTPFLCSRWVWLTMFQYSVRSDPTILQRYRTTIKQLVDAVHLHCPNLRAPAQLSCCSILSEYIPEETIRPIGLEHDSWFD